MRFNLAFDFPAVLAKRPVDQICCLVSVESAVARLETDHIQHGFSCHLEERAPVSTAQLNHSAGERPQIRAIGVVLCSDISEHSNTMPRRRPTIQIPTMAASPACQSQHVDPPSCIRYPFVQRIQKYSVL